MTKKIPLVLATAYSLLVQPCFAQATDVAPRLARDCQQQQLQIQELANNRQKMELEITRLRDDIRRLNETIDRIRSQVGGDWARPTQR